MARFTKNYMLEIGAVMMGVGFVFVFLSYALRFADPSWLSFYRNGLKAIPGAEPEDYNLWVMIVSSILFISGAFYFGEQVVLRRRFERLIDTPKRSEFVSNRKRLDELARRLPSQYKQRVQAKEATFRSLR